MVFADDFWIQLLQEDLLVPIVAIVFGCTIAIVAIVFGTVKAMVVGTAREATKREIAAYVAEGTIDAEKAVALIKAGETPDDGEDE